jgi:hypothetical protein
MTITRTITLDDLTPDELAELFCKMFADEQAAFFAKVAQVASTWPGAGMCQQACAIADHLDHDGRYAIERLADHAGLLTDDAMALAEAGQ